MPGKLGLVDIRVEAADAGTKDGGSDAGREAPDHVHDAASGEVDGANVQQGFALEGAQKSLVGPDPVHDNGVDKGGEEEGVGRVGEHAATFSDGSRNDRRGSRGEGELEEEVVEGVLALELSGEEEERGADDLVSVVVLAVSESISERPEGEGADARIQQVFEHNVLHVLRSHRSGTKHGKAGLHHEHQNAAEQNPHNVGGYAHGIDLALEGIDLFAHRLKLQLLADLINRQVGHRWLSVVWSLVFFSLGSTTLLQLVLILGRHV